MDITFILTIINSILLIVGLGLLYTVFQNAQQEAKHRSHQNQAADAALEEAHNKAKHIIERAVERAQDTLAQTEYIRQDIIDSLEKDLKEVSDATVESTRQQAMAFNDDYQKVLAEMRAQHGELLDQAHSALQDVESLKKKLVDEVEAKVSDVSTKTTEAFAQELLEVSTEYKDALRKTVAEYTKAAHDVVQHIVSIPEAELKDFRQILQTETVESQKVLSQRINQAFDDVQREIEEYKKAQITKVDAGIQRSVEKIMEEVLAGSFTREDHMKLIQAALKQAQADQILTAGASAS